MAHIHCDFTPFGFLFPGEPNDMHDDEEDCAVINYYDDSEDQESPMEGGYWGDEKCDQQHPFVCKIKTV